MGKVAVGPSTLAIAAVAIIFIALFTGPIGDRRFVWITRFSYVFTIAELLASVLPFVLLEEPDLKVEFPPFRGRFTAWDSSRALRWLRVQCWTYPPLVVDG